MSDIFLRMQKMGILNEHETVTPFAPKQPCNGCMAIEDNDNIHTI